MKIGSGKLKINYVGNKLFMIMWIWKKKYPFWCWILSFDFNRNKYHQGFYKRISYFRDCGGTGYNSFFGSIHFQWQKDGRKIK